MSKREARLARASQKALKDAEKTARLVTKPSDKKAVRVGANPDSVFHMQMTWTVEHRDCKGAWSSGTARQWSDGDWDGNIHPKLTEWSRLTWAEIDTHVTGNEGKRHKMHHSMAVDAILDEAQLRLIDLDKLEETIFRFRLGNLPRLWGFRRVGEFHVLWFDPKHEIYPTDPS